MVFFISISILIEHSVTLNAASDLGLHCLPMSHKKETRLMWVNAKKIADFVQLCLPINLLTFMFREYNSLSLNFGFS